MKKFLPLSLSLLLIAACQTNPEQYPEHKCNETEDNFIITEVNEPLTQEQIELIENAVSQSSTKTLYHVDLQNLQSFLGESQVQVLVFFSHMVRSMQIIQTHRRGSVRTLH